MVKLVPYPGYNPLNEDKEYNNLTESSSASLHNPYKSILIKDLSQLNLTDTPEVVLKYVLIQDY